jgi:hypothetical protein
VGWGGVGFGAVLIVQGDLVSRSERLVSFCRGFLFDWRVCLGLVLVFRWDSMECAALGEVRVDSCSDCVLSSAPGW